MATAIPKCRLCGEHHNLRDPHAWTGGSGVASPTPKRSTDPRSTGSPKRPDPPKPTKPATPERSSAKPVITDKDGVSISEWKKRALAAEGEVERIREVNAERQRKRRDKVAKLAAAQAPTKRKAKADAS